jgi:hypothetical protein
MFLNFKLFDRGRLESSGMRVFKLHSLFPPHNDNCTIGMVKYNIPVCVYDSLNTFL